jgi:hypothetical protein
MKGVDFRNDDSAELLPLWEKCEDCREGQTAIHAGGKKYLPPLSGQSDADFRAYVRRATFYGAMSRTVDAFIGMIMRTPPNIDNYNSLLDDVINSNQSIYEFTTSVIDDVLVKGFGGILVEHTPQVEGVMTLAQAQLMGSRPYLTFFEAKSILNWRCVKGNPVMVVLEEEDYVYSSEFEFKEECIYRVLDLDDQGYYRQRIFKRNERQPDEFDLIQEIWPLMNGNKITEIPFYFLGDAEHLPPLIDLVDLNISHYMTTADLEAGCHWAGTPQPWIAGVQLEANDQLKFGGNAWVFPDPSAKAQYLEFSGQGLGALEKRLEIKERQMAALGAKMLSDTVVAETATGASLRSSGEFSVLNNVAQVTSKVITRACTFMYQWAGLAPVKISLNTDYMPASASPQDIQAWLQAYQAGAISFQSLYGNLKKGEVYLFGEDPETEQAAITTQPLNLNA